MPRRQAVVPLPGQIDVCNANRVAEAVASAVSQGGTVTADMSATTFCDCAGARHRASHKRAAASGSELRVVVTTPQVRRLFELLEIDGLLNIPNRPTGH